MIFGKSVDEVTVEDLQALIEREVCESETLEYKADLPSRRGADSWYQNGNGIGDYARNELLSEIVGFANSLGGTLVLGLSETPDAPPRAHAINPIPSCADLALRLEQQAGSCIEPQIPRLKFRGIPVGNDGGGVVVAHAPRSHMAPHRLAVTRECYTRRGERTERMTMREIRDLVLTTRDLSQHIERRFSDGDRSFEAEFLKISGQANAINAFSVVAVPLDPDRIYLDTLRDLEHPQNLFRANGNVTENGQHGMIEGMFPRGHLQWKPMLRGAVGTTDHYDASHRLRFELHNSGDVRIQLYIVDDPHGQDRFYPSWLVGLVASTFAGVTMIRDASREQDMEYGLEARWLSKSEQPIRLMGWRDRGLDGMQERHMPTDVTLPRYSVSTELSELLNLFVRDMWNVVGIRSGADAEAIWELITP